MRIFHFPWHAARMARFAGHAGNPATRCWREIVAALHAEGLEGVTLSSDATKAASAIPADAATKIICVGLNYLDHAAEGKQEVPKFPVFFIRYLSSFVADGEALVAPAISQKYDYEAELAFVVGRTARHVPKERALDYIYGYTLGMDGSVRDYQKRTPQWTLGKNFDRSGALGPMIVPAVAVPPGASGFAIRSRLNGVTMQEDNTREMVFDVATLLSSVSECMTLQPGDIVLTGTPAGVGFARMPPLYLKPGDLLEIEIEGIGTLRNPVVRNKY